MICPRHPTKRMATTSNGREYCPTCDKERRIRKGVIDLKNPKVLSHTEKMFELMHRIETCPAYERPELEAYPARPARASKEL